jgi:Peptidase family M28
MTGWRALVKDRRWFLGRDRYPIPAYSEFMPPPRVGCKPCTSEITDIFRADDPFGWHVTEYEEREELLPGLASIGRQILDAVRDLGEGRPAQGLAKGKLAGNPCWPPELAERAPLLTHERYVLLLPLALSRTQDDKGRVRWTLFGSSELGPAAAFWQSFRRSPREELPEEEAHAVLRDLLVRTCGEKPEAVRDLRAAGLRFLPQGGWPEERMLPGWVDALGLPRRPVLRAVKYLLTFRPFAELPRPVREAYLSGRLCLLPCPGSLAFWGARGCLQLRKELPLAMQFPLLDAVDRRESPLGIRVPQAGWLYQPSADKPDVGRELGRVKNDFRRTHRWERVRRDDDVKEDAADKLVQVLFSVDPDDLGLYGKPMARNVQMWTHDFRLRLDGPRAEEDAILAAEADVRDGGTFGYRVTYPAMRVGRHEVYWHRPVVGFVDPKSREPAVVPTRLHGFLTAYRDGRPLPGTTVDLWPRLQERPPHIAALEIFDRKADARSGQTIGNVRKLFQAAGFHPGGRLPRSFARQLLTAAKDETLEGWLASLPGRSTDAERAKKLVQGIQEILDASPENDLLSDGKPIPSLTFRRTARREFEVAFWKRIAELSHGRFLNKENADRVLDGPSLEAAKALGRSERRELDALGDHLLAAHLRSIQKAGMQSRAWAGELPFRWQTRSRFPWMGGWARNQTGELEERNLIVVIPGRDRRRAVVMADHYDTAYMEDVYAGKQGPKGARLAAQGADDNHSATATLLLAAPIFLEMSRKGQLDCDIWLVHLTGEEFPSDCLGARDLCQNLVQRTLRARRAGGRMRDLSKVRVQGAYVLDMIAHNHDRDGDTFQITPGSGRESLWLAWHAHVANELWNRAAAASNRRPDRRRAPERSERSEDPRRIPSIARFPRLSGEIRPPFDPKSTLFNTDAQILSDAGVPVVLFMENYDISRSGYHDTKDTMGNIDLDYGAAVAAIAIETVARAASERPARPPR